MLQLKSKKVKIRTQMPLEDRASLLIRGMPFFRNSTELLQRLTRRSHLAK